MIETAWSERGEQKWPGELVLIRHGESAGNVARDEAMAKGLPTIDIAPRDCDVRLTCLAQRPHLLHGLEGRAVLAPHPGEMARMLSRDRDEIEADSVG